MQIYVDGSSLDNDKVDCFGGWCYTIYNDKYSIIKEGSGSEMKSTSQRMELQALIRALDAYNQLSKEYKGPVTFYSDSIYVINGINKNWFVTWLANGWKNAKNQPVANQDLWEELIDLLQITGACQLMVLRKGYIPKWDNKIKFCWIKGHDNNKYHDRCDVEARNQAEKLRSTFKEWRRKKDASPPDISITDIRPDRGDQFVNAEI